MPVWFLRKVGSLLPLAQVGQVSPGPLRPVGSLGPFGSVRLLTYQWYSTSGPPVDGTY